MACEICKGSRHVFEKDKGWIRCTCWYRERAISLMKKGNFPSSLLQSRPEDFKMRTDKSKHMGAAIKKKITNFDTTPYFIYSITPVKELVAAIITKYSIINDKLLNISRVQYITLGEWTENTFVKDAENFDLKRMDILVLSVGREITNTAHKSHLFNILYEMVLHEKFVILLSAIPLSQFSQRYTDSCFQLINEYFDKFEC